MKVNELDFSDLEIYIRLGRVGMNIPLKILNNKKLLAKLIGVLKKYEIRKPVEA